MNDKEKLELALQNISYLISTYEMKLERNQQAAIKYRDIGATETASYKEGIRDNISSNLDSLRALRNKLED